MQVQDIDCYDSAYFYQNYCYVNTERLLVGKYGNRDNLIYLYFRLPVIYELDRINNAKLIIYKSTINRPCYIERRNVYCVSPLLIRFSTLNCAYIDTHTDYGKCVYFEDMQPVTYEEIDITHIVKAWACNNLENKGLLINGVHNASILSLTSQLYIPRTMRPIIRITYNDIHISRPLIGLPCKVKVSDTFDN